MDALLEILKYTIPALIVFATIYFIMKNFLSNQLALQSLKYKQDKMSGMLPLRLQAYERLALFGERISIDNLSYRLSTQEMDAKSMSTAMMIAIQQEYEHNLSQQIYVSDKLWEIISLAKNQMQNVISKAESTLGSGASPAQLVGEVEKLMESSNVNPVTMIRKAIKKEMEIVL